MEKQPSWKPTPGEEPKCVAHPCNLIILNNLSHIILQNNLAPMSMMFTPPLCLGWKGIHFWAPENLPFMPLDEIKSISPKFDYETEQVKQVLWRHRHKSIWGGIV